MQLRRVEAVLFDQRLKIVQSEVQVVLARLLWCDWETVRVSAIASDAQGSPARLTLLELREEGGDALGGRAHAGRAGWYSRVAASAGRL